MITVNPWVALLVLTPFLVAAGIVVLVGILTDAAIKMAEILREHETAELQDQARGIADTLTEFPTDTYPVTRAALEDQAAYIDRKLKGER